MRQLVEPPHRQGFVGEVAVLQLGRALHQRLDRRRKVERGGAEIYRPPAASDDVPVARPGWIGRGEQPGRAACAEVPQGRPDMFVREVAQAVAAQNRVRLGQRIHATVETTTPEITPVNTIVTTPQNMMVVTHKVADFAKWKTSYDEHDSLRLANGIHSYVIGRGMQDSNMVLVAVKVDDMAKAKAFAKDPSLKKAMQKGGVTGAPTISFITTIWQDTGLSVQTSGPGPRLL